MKTLNRKQLRTLILEEYADSVEPQGFFSDKAQEYIAKALTKNAKEISGYFPYGTQTIVEKAIKRNAAQLAKCIVDLAK